MSETAEIAKLRAALAAETARAEAQSALAKAAHSELLQIRATVSCSEALIKELKLEIAKLRRDKYGKSSRAQRPAARPAGTAARGIGSGRDRG